MQYGGDAELNLSDLFSPLPYGKDETYITLVSKTMAKGVL